MNDNWIEIVETLQPYVKYNSKELKYQREIENCLKLLGWRSSNKTMQSQVTINIGHKNSIRPDIVLYKNCIPVLPIEIKRPNNSCNIKQESQLMSYMRQLRLNIGLYIGENIQLYYDNPDDFESPISVFKIEFREDETNGDIFCEMLSYEKFDISSLEDFCKERYNQISARNNLQQRFSEYFADSNVTKNIKSLLKEKFVKEGFDENILEDELNKFVCRIEWKRTLNMEKRIENTVINVPASKNHEREFSLDGVKYWCIRRFVLAVVKQYVSDHPYACIEELKKQFPMNLCSYKKYNSMICDKKEIEEIDLKKRFFSKPEEIIRLVDSTEITVCSQWGNTGNLKKYFQRFLEHIRTFYPVYSR